MKLISIPELWALNGETVAPGSAHCRISAGSALLILRKTGQWPHKLTATSRYPTDVPREFDGVSVLFPGSRRAIDPKEDHSRSGYEFPLWTMEGLIYVPRWCDIVGNTLVAIAEANEENRAGGYPMDWEMAWQDGHTVSSTSVLEVA